MTSGKHRTQRGLARALTAICGVLALTCLFPPNVDAKITIKNGVAPAPERLSERPEERASERPADSSRPSEKKSDPRRVPATDSLAPADANDASAWFQEETARRLRDDALRFAKTRRADWPDFQPLRVEKLKELGIRRLRSKRVSFYTDLASSQDVDQIPDALEAAIPEICRFFKIDGSRFDDLEIEAFLMDDPRPFIELGALDAPPRFLHGYSFGDRIFAKRHESPYYNRFLLTHELVHTIMHELFGDLRPQWFSEGSAEYLGLHSWNAKTNEIMIAYRPESEEETPGFGRTRAIQKLVASGVAPTIRRIMQYESEDFADTTTYAWCWALVSFLYNAPKYQEIAETLPYWATADDPNRLFIEAIGDRWGELEYDWVDYISRLDYEYDYQRAAIDVSSRIASEYDLAQGVVVFVDPAKGWQGTGVELQANRTYQIVAAGRFDYYLPAAEKVMEFEAPGATCEYLFGKPAGRLLAAVAPSVENATFADVYGESASPRENPRGRNEQFRFSAFKDDAFPRFGNETNPLYPWDEVFDYAASKMTLTPTRDGELYLRVNALPKRLKQNSGSLKAKIKLID